MRDCKYTKIFLALVIAFSLPIVTVVTMAHALDYHIDSEGGERCDWCHGPHNVFGSLLNEVDSETLCLTCHEPGVDPDAPDATVHAPLSDSPVTCVGCHGTHSNKVNHLGNANTSLILTSVLDSNILSPTFGTYYNVDFEDPDPKFVNLTDRDEFAGIRRICQVCHIAPPNDNPHNVIVTETNCTNCHKHNDGFKAGGGGGGGG
jgi:predicted CXXCH cytochrome family protein